MSDQLTADELAAPELAAPELAAPGRAAALDPPLRPVRSVNVFEETVESILRLVKLGLLLPGERLPSERELAKQLEVSRPTVREALRSLARTGYLQTLRGRSGGTYVLEWRTDPSDEQVRALAREMGDDLLDALDFRLVVEPGGAALAASRATAADAARLDAALEVLAAAPRVTFPATDRVAVDGDLEHDDPAPLSDMPDPVPLSYRFADRRLHLLIADIARSPSVAAAVTQAQLRLSDLLSSTPQMEGALRHSDQQHEQIVSAIKRGDAGAAQQAMREHVAATASYVRGFLE
ncbi:MAG: GntR family transcriptional regulator, transcriptional repressor for pyruvate dehydrogenase complex [Solirubrobacteraceae bacterium]|nr:GntR family transcriptional regulator, transcriptional repressor for pyruvate dehydrogenase complex [Solirubrobacteraceae bacterium]